MRTHRGHVVLCGAVIAVALMAVVVTGGAPVSIGLLVAALLCPLAMGGVLWLLVRPGGHAAADHVDAEGHR
jgi:hypothetical protein